MHTEQRAGYASYKRMCSVHTWKPCAREDSNLRIHGKNLNFKTGYLERQNAATDVLPEIPLEHYITTDRYDLQRSEKQTAKLSDVVGAGGHPTGRCIVELVGCLGNRTGVTQGHPPAGDP